MIRKYPFPLDTPVDEEIEVEKPKYTLSEDKKNIVTELVKEKVKIQTIYTKADLQIMMCQRGKHNWVMTDKHIYEARCKNSKCIKVRILSPLVHTIKDGHIISKYTKEIID